MAAQENFLQHASNSQTWSINHLNDEQKIQEILQEQQKLQTLYNEVVVYIQEHQTMSAEEMLKYQSQLKQLSEYYQANQEKLKLLGYSNLQVNKDVVIKKGARNNISVKSIFMGCGAIIFFLIIGLIFLFYYLVQNPSQFSGLGSLGITPATAKSLLMGMTLTVMLVILLLAIVIIIMNVYKAFTVKNRPKGWYYGGIIFGVLILWVALGAGTKVLGEVGKIQVDSLANPEDVVLAYAMTPSQENPNSNFPIARNSVLIAPINIPFKLLKGNYERYVELEIGKRHITSLQLDCGNDRILNYNPQSDFFQGACFYTKKGNYKVQLIVGYLWEENQAQTATLFLKDIVILSELTLSVPWDKKLEQSDNEFIVGPLPTELSFNADQIFRDLGLKNYRINWDGNGDGNIDKSDDSNFVFSFEKAAVVYPRFSLPDVNADLFYSFPLRVEKSLTPVCTFDFTQKKVNDYTVGINFYDGGERFISDYSYLIFDNSTNQLVDELNGKDMGMLFDYRFPGKGIYLFKMNFITNEGKKGSCEGEVRLTDKASYTVNYEILVSTPRSPFFQKLDPKPIETNKMISLSEVPTKIKLKLNSIDPKTYNSLVNIFFDGKPIVETVDNEYLFDVRDSNEHRISIKIEDKVRGLLYEEELKTQIGLDDIVGNLKVIWEQSGFSPLSVTLDASATKLNDPNDEIAYFSRDFGDGISQNNLSNAIIKHIYHYNIERNNGVFKPQVTIFTKKGRSLTFGLDEPIIVNKQLISLEINSPSHPAQEARVGDRVVFALDFNGLPKKIHWSFDENEQAISCDGRECIEMTKTFDQKGMYLVKVSIEFDDEQTVEQRLAFKVR